MDKNTATKLLTECDALISHSVNDGSVDKDSYLKLKSLIRKRINDYVVKIWEEN